MLMKKLYNN